MVTHTMPSWAKRLPSYQGIAAVPYSKALPGIQTITGCLDDQRSEDQILRVKQSSPMVASSGRITLTSGGYDGWGVFGPYLRASRTPLQVTTGCGGRSRLAPKGGAA